MTFRLLTIAELMDEKICDICHQAVAKLKLLGPHWLCERCYALNDEG